MVVVHLLKNRSDDMERGRKDPYEEYFDKVNFIPVVDHIPVEVETLIEILHSPEFVQGVDALIVTSQRAVDVLKLALNRLRDTFNVLEKPVYTVGPTTASRLQLLGFHTVNGAESGNGKALAEAMIEKYASSSPQCFLFMAGEIHRDYLPQKLIDAGHTVQKRIVYRTIPHEHTVSILKGDLKSGDWLVFFSPSHTVGVLNHLRTRQGIRIGAIGPTTEEFLRSQNIHVDAVAASPTAECLKLAITEKAS